MAVRSTASRSKTYSKIQKVPELAPEDFVGRVEEPQTEVPAPAEQEVNNVVPPEDTPPPVQPPIQTPVGPPQFPASPPPQPQAGLSFSGMVDDRVIPDAGLPTENVSGILDKKQEGHGLLRPHFSPSNMDVYISSSQIRRFALRPGDLVEGPARRPKENERYWGLLKVEIVNGHPIGELGRRPHFDELTPIFPEERLALETGKDPLSARLIDLVAPIGKGQRGMIVSPPKAGKTTILKDIALGVAVNYPKVHLMAVLIGERPE